MSSARDAVLALLFPSFCHLCGSLVDSWDDGIVCGDCWAGSGRETDGKLCSKCGLTLRSSAFDVCGTCDQLRFAEARSCGSYTGVWRESVLWLKQHPQLAPRLAELLANEFRQMNRERAIDSIMPVPLHRERERRRGFNQAAVIAAEVGKRVGVKVDLSSLVRTAKTIRHRAGMDAAERASSLEGAFQIRAQRGVRGRAILLIDDLMTTGATASESARVLLEAGAVDVRVLSIARVNSAPLWGKRLAQV